MRDFHDNVPSSCGNTNTRSARGRSPVGVSSPLATGLDYVKHRVHYPAEGMFPLPFLRVYDFFYNLPLIISEVGWIRLHNLTVL